tara:strand:- start:431 stop:856 length:426 start_codon:yes stop_codon:yes gene_type:complete
MSVKQLDPTWSMYTIATAAGATDFHYGDGGLTADCTQEALDAAVAAYDHAAFVAAGKVKVFTELVQNHLNSVARESGYDDIFTAISYATSSHATRGPQGVAFRDWRDTVWDTCNVLLGTWQTGGTEPTLEEVLAALPTFTG